MRQWVDGGIEERMTTQLKLDGRSIALDIAARRPALRLSFGGTSHEVVELPAEDGAFELKLDGRVYRGWRCAGEREVYVRLEGRTFVIGLAEAGGAAEAKGKHANAVRSEMPGTVIDIHCIRGDEVKAGDMLLTIESMKLQIGVAAPRDGVIEDIHVAANATFERDALLVSFAAFAERAEAGA